MENTMMSNGKLINPQTDEIWEARVQFWPGDEERHMLVVIYYAWKDGRIQFVPALCYDGDPIWAESCDKFELIQKVGQR